MNSSILSVLVLMFSSLSACVAVGPEILPQLRTLRQDLEIAGDEYLRARPDMAENWAAILSATDEMIVLVEAYSAGKVSQEAALDTFVQEHLPQAEGLILKLLGDDDEYTPILRVSFRVIVSRVHSALSTPLG